ncbi:MAG TPA: DNA polymerase III subunit gamma/tau, partial [bacterium]|nr:DNA polymerase III subunit gamma/tau [bacterium]
VLEIDGASNNSVDDVRTIRENISYGPVKSKRKAYIIDEVHMLSKSAFNALLKTLEEPPTHTVFILATTDPQKIPMTVLSRCQRYDLRRLGTADIVRQLEKILTAEKVSFDREALFLIAREGDGSMRDAQTLVEQMLAFGERTITGTVVTTILGISDRALIRGIVEAVARRDADAAVTRVREIYASGKALEKAARDVLFTLHQLVLASSLSDDRFLEASDEERRWVRESARLLTPADWLRLFDLWSKESDRILRSEYPLLLFEISVVLAASLPVMTDLRTLLDTLRDAPVPAARSHEPAPAIQNEPPRGAPKTTQPTARTAEPVPPPSPTTTPKAEPIAPPTVTGWRDFVERLAQEEPMTGGALKTVTALEKAGTVTVQIPQATKALLDPKKEMLTARFAELTGGRKLRFADEMSEGTSVAQQETKEEKEKNAKIREEVRNDPTVKKTEQAGFDFKKSSPT